MLPLYLLMMMSCSSVFSTELTLEEQFKKLSRQKRYLTIPYGSAIGMIAAFAVPVDLPNQDILLSWNFEGNYNLPDQLYYFGTPPSVPDLNQDPDLPDPERRSLRSLSRTHFYQLLQDRLQIFGLGGRDCLLRMVCEISQSVLDHNGLLGQILQILFTPSSSQAEDALTEFTTAEVHGAEGANCSNVYPECLQSPLDLFSTMTR